MAPLSNIRRIFINTFFFRNGRLRYRWVSTTEKKEDNSKECESAGAVNKKPLDFSKPLENKNWISYGFDYLDKSEDRYQMHMSMFLIFSVFFCGTAFLYAYYPDRSRRDWARREAFIRLHEREQLGLEPIDKNFIDPSKIVLPPDEELAEEDIVI